MTRKKRKVFIWAPYNPKKGEAWGLWAGDYKLDVACKLDTSFLSGWRTDPGLEIRKFEMVLKKRRGKR